MAQAHLKTNTQNCQNNSCVNPLIRHKSVQAVHVFTRRCLLVHQGIERRPEPSSSLLPGRYDLVASCPSHWLAETGIVEEVVVSPVVERGAGDEDSRSKII